MAAPLGFKSFNTGDILSASDTNGYLMQGVLVFADAAARSAAITSPQEGQTSYLKDTDVIQVYSGSAWVTKSGGSSPLTTKGDLYTYSTTDARLAVGTNGYTLVADSSTATGLKWATPAGGGKVLQVVNQDQTTRVDAATTTYTDTGTTLSITPSSATSKILVLVTHSMYINQNANTINGNIRLMRDSTAIFQTVASAGQGTIQASALGVLELAGYTFTYLDSPATTSSVTYKTQMAVQNTGSSSNISVNVRSGSSSQITLLEIGA